MAVADTAECEANVPAGAEAEATPPAADPPILGVPMFALSIRMGS
jgi:hypothetical protein